MGLSWNFEHRLKFEKERESIFLWFLGLEIKLLKDGFALSMANYCYMVIAVYNDETKLTQLIIITLRHALVQLGTFILFFKMINVKCK